MQQQAQGQFTPEQLIVAGRRAEAQGQAAHALQFYHYIAEAFPQATEAYEARDAIYRLSEPQAHTQVPAQAVGHGQSSMINASMTNATMTNVRPSEGRGSTSLEAGPGPSHGRPLKGGKRARQAAAEDDDTDEETARPGYRVGRLVAAMLATMGWLMLLGGLLLGPMMIVALTVKSVPKPIREMVAANLLATGVLTFGAIFFGLLALFAAQTARATYDTADAVRDLLASGR
jgi:hypothetical protein